MFQSRFSRASLGEERPRRYDNKVKKCCPLARWPRCDFYAKPPKVIRRANRLRLLQLSADKNLLTTSLPGQIYLLAAAYNL